MHFDRAICIAFEPRFTSIKCQDKADMPLSMNRQVDRETNMQYCMEIKDNANMFIMYSTFAQMYRLANGWTGSQHVVMHPRKGVAAFFLNLTASHDPGPKYYL